MFNHDVTCWPDTPGMCCTESMRSLVNPVTANEQLDSLVQLVCNGDFSNAEKVLRDLKRTHKDKGELPDLWDHYDNA